MRLTVGGACGTFCATITSWFPPMYTASTVLSSTFDQNIDQGKKSVLVLQDTDYAAAFQRKCGC
jgi:hypothetical protein